LGKEVLGNRGGGFFAVGYGAYGEFAVSDGVSACENAFHACSALIIYDYPSFTVFVEAKSPTFLKPLLLISFAHSSIMLNTGAFEAFLSSSMNK